jgi:hypothetical protein
MENSEINSDIFETFFPQEKDRRITRKEDLYPSDFDLFGKDFHKNELGTQTYSHISELHQRRRIKFHHD